MYLLRWNAVLLMGQAHSSVAEHRLFYMCKVKISSQQLQFKKGWGCWAKQDFEEPRLLEQTLLCWCGGPNIACHIYTFLYMVLSAQWSSGAQASFVFLLGLMVRKHQAPLAFGLKA